MDQCFRILMAEDQPHDAELVERQLRRGGFDFVARRVDRHDAFVQALTEFSPDLILSDFSMPSFDGLTALDLAREKSPDVPFIFVSGTIGEERAMEAMTHGAIDYVQKDRPQRLLSAVTRALEERKKRFALRESQDALQASEGRFRSFMKHMPARACIADRQTKYTFVNKAWERAYGLKSEDVIGRTFSEVLPAERAGDLKARHDKVVETNDSFSTTFQIGLEGRWWYCTYFPIHDGAGNVASVGTVAVEVTEQKQQEEKLNYLAHYDALTGLPNRSLFRDRLVHAIAKAKRDERRIALMFIDLDRFKEVNDTLGHTAGDEVLQLTARMLEDSLRDVDTIARIGGDEFTVILEEAAELDKVAIVAKRIRKAFSEPLTIQGREFLVTPSIGISVYPDDADSAEGLLKTADTAMYQAKKAGRNTYEFYAAELNDKESERLRMQSLLRHALARKEFVLYYQPKVESESGRIVGAEALIRWNSAELGLIAPVQFIPLAEESGLIESIGEWVIKSACMQNKAWQDEGIAPLMVSVNLSPRQLRQKNLVRTITRILMESGLAPQSLEIELTESVIMENIHENIEALTAIRGMGISLAIDDFGTGYSSLSYLASLPINTLKIDRSFIVTMAEKAHSLTIVSSIISLACSLGLKVIAEGVETEAQRLQLQLLKCLEVQGFLFHRPLPAESIALLLRAQGIRDLDREKRILALAGR